MVANLKGDYSKYPESVREIIPLIAGEVCMLRQAWSVYARLFMEDKKRTDIYCKHAGQLLGLLQRHLRDHMFLSISRLIDIDKGKQRNLSIWRLVEIASESDNIAFVNESKKELESLCSNAQALILHRNKRIAHFDIKVCLEEEMLPPVMFNQLLDLVKSIEVLLNKFNWEFLRSTTLFDAMVASDVTGGFDTIVAKALMYDRLENEGVVAKFRWRDAII